MEINKICLIVDSSEAFLNNQLKEILKKWENEEITNITEWKFGSSLTAIPLFGEPPIIHLNLQDSKNLTKFNNLIKNDKNNLFTNNWYGAGLIITTTTAKGISSIEKLVQKSKGTIHKKRKPQEIKNELLSGINVNNSIKELLSSHVGEDYDKLLSTINEIKKLTIEEQKELTVDKVISMIPMQPGSVLPWEYINHVFSGDIYNSVNSTKRTLQNSHCLVLMVFLKRKLELAYRIKILKNDNINDNKIYSEILNVANGPELWGANTLANKLSLSTLEYIVKIIAKAESDIKGGSYLDPNLIFELLIVKTTLAIKFNKCLENLGGY